MSKSIFLYLFMQAALLHLTAYAQLNAPLPFRTLTVADGLPQSFISGLEQDKQGFIWIGTRDGLARYDGIQYKLFNHVGGDTTTLAANVITNLYLDSRSQLWITYESKDIDVLNTVTEHLFHFSAHPKYNILKGKTKGTFSTAQFMAEDQLGRLWFPCDDGGLFICHLQQGTLCFLSDSALGLAGNRITGLSAAGNNMLLATDTALVTMNLQYRHLSTIPYSFSSPHLFNPRKRWKDTRPTIRKNGDIVLLDESRLLIYHANTKLFTEYPLPDRAQYSGPCMATDNRNNLYFDFDGTIYLLTTDSQILVWRKQQPGLFANNISMLFDQSGLLWAGGNGSGITLYDLRLKHVTGTYYKNNFFPDVLQLHAGVPAADITGSFINTISNYRLRHTKDHNNNIWFSVAGLEPDSTLQLLCLKNNRLQKVHFTPAAPGQEHSLVSGLAVSKKGLLWGVDFYSRIIRFDTRNNTSFTHPAILPHAGFNDLLIDGEDVFWLTSIEKGLFSYQMRTGQVRQFEQGDRAGQLPNGQLLDMQHDPFDSTLLWIGSLGGGLIQFNKTTGYSRCYTTRDGLPNNTVYSLMPDSRGVLWCSSNKGIFTFNTRTKEVRSFTAKDGLLNDEFNRFHFITLPDGHMAFGGVEAYTVLDPLALTEDHFQPKVALTGLSIHNEPADYGHTGSPFTQSLNSLDKITLPYHQNFLSFHFAALEYNIPEKLQYRYRLVNLDDKWVYAKTGNTATYTNVPSGSYELLINATNTSGIWSPYIKRIQLVITPPFWKTWWFITLCALMAITLIAAGIYSRIKAVRVKVQQQLRFDREVMELQAQALRAQMNPHFIFNCLNSIKLLIQEEKKQEAVVYLTTFSKLIRNQLNSIQKEISLAEELKTCKLYTQMEALRFGENIVCTFHIADEADIYSLMVPPMIIQPFIENAIWHGVLPQKNGGRVTVTVIDDPNTVSCIIDDDGVGREQSQKPAVGVGTQHQSKGLQLTQSRMHLYNLVQNRGGSITITDKKDEQGKATGTTVTILFKKEIA